MKSWPLPFLPAVPGTGPVVRVHDTASDAEVAVQPNGPARMYVCGITPYDATHLGHAATYLTFDLLGRALRDAGHQVVYAQNITDVDDPLLERAERDGITWEALAAKEIALFREDMTALGIIPPDHYIGVVESIEPVVAAVEKLRASGAAYQVPVDGGPGQDTYFDLSADPQWGGVSGWSREQMMAVFADRGGDPDRVGKRDQLDPLLWRAHRPGEPSWDGGSLGSGRPGWHIECSTIALGELGTGFDVQGGGSDLIFPHHEMSASQAVALTGQRPFARAYVHQGMVGYEGAKMSKSKGNLVLVSKLRRDGVDPMAIRLALLAHHYRQDWEWTDDDLAVAVARLERWRSALSVNTAPSADETVAAIRAALTADLDAPTALEAVDAWAAATLDGSDDGTRTNGAPGVLARALDALLGVRV